MKKIKIILFGAAMLLSTACHNLLDEDVRSQITDNHLNTATGFNEGVNASYSFIRSFYGFNEHGPTATVFGTDEFTNGFDGSQKSFNFYDFGLNPRHAVVTGLWSNLYIAINTCNAVITRAPIVEGVEESLKTRRVAEVRFLRAQYYFLLVQMFGPVHLSLTEVQGVETSATRAPVPEVYKVIIDDLNFAIQNLPNVNSEYGRATKPAAEHLLAKVYLTKAGSSAKEVSQKHRNILR